MSKLIAALIVTLMPALVWAGPVDINTATKDVFKLLPPIASKAEQMCS